MTERMKRMILILAIVCGGLIAFNGIKALLMKRFFAQYRPPAVTVSSVKAVERAWEPTIHAVGNFVAINGVEVNAQASGNVTAIHFESGQYVSENSPLIDIDDRVDRAMLKAHQSELTLQTLNYQRQSDLLKNGATSGAMVDETKARLLQAEADVEKTNSLIQQKHITAPFSGQLGIRLINLGQYITPGQTSIVTLQSMDPLYLEFYVPEQILKKITPNQSILFSTEQHPDLFFEGKISAINARVDTNTHNIEIQATLPNCPADAIQDIEHSPLITMSKKKYHGKPVVICNTEINQKNSVNHYYFIPGMFASIDIKEPSTSQVVVVPTTAISYSLYGNAVYLIENDAKNPDIHTVKRVFVTTGEQDGNDIVITKGITANQTVVSSGELKLQDGTAVVINNRVQLHAVEHPNQLGE